MTTDIKRQPCPFGLPIEIADLTQVYTDQRVELATTTFDPYVALRDRPKRAATPIRQDA